MSLEFDWNHFDSIIGKPSSSKILRMLVINDKLSVKELKELTEISESQLHVLLRNLVEVNILMKITRGLYGFSNHPFAKLIKEAYLAIIREYLNNSIYNIQELIKKGEKEEAFEILKEIISIYKPLLERDFSRIMATLSHEFI